MFKLLKKLIKRQNSKAQPMQPYYAIKRPLCPFYGFIIIGNRMVDQAGNMCALESRPCFMQMRKNQDPQWADCTFFNHPGNKAEFDKLKTLLKVAPLEFRPPKQQHSWQGMLLQQWWSYILKN